VESADVSANGPRGMGLRIAPSAQTRAILVKRSFSSQKHELAAIAVLHIDGGGYAHSADVTIRLLINGNLVASIG
jgi:hypothetical protein